MIEKYKILIKFPNIIYSGVNLMSKITVLGISGSPRKGNSEFLLKKALEAAEKESTDAVECIMYSIRGKKFGPCIACGRCADKGECIIKDDFQELCNLWLKADVVIYSVPVYHMGIPGQLKCFIDRLGNTTFGRYRHLFKPGEDKLPKFLKVIGSISQGIHVFSGQEHTMTDLINHTLLMQCIPVAGDMWESYIGVGGWTSNSGDRKALEKQVSDGVFDAEVAVKAARDLGKRAVEVALLVREGVVSRRKQLTQDPAYIPYLENMDR